VTARIGPFELQRELGRGGMGVVHLAVDTRLDRQVAIKALPEHLAADPARLERFRREARTLAGLSHPNIAGIHGVEEQDGATHLVLEYVEGETLADRLDRGPLTVHDAIECAAQVAAALEAAHDAGVIHRDLKPANVIITPDGVAKVLDFGLARADEQYTTAADPDSPTITQRPQHSPTIEGAILGTAPYMSPEQARGRRVDRRTDIWALGVLLYEMLAGSSPFLGETAADSLGAVLHKELDLAALPPSASPAVRRILARCLERDRSARWRDAGDVRVELLAALRDEPDAATPAPPQRAPSRSILAAAGWLLAAAALALLALQLRPGPPPPLTHTSITAPDGVRIITFALSPDGRRVAITGDTAESATPSSSFVDSAWVRSLASSEWRAVPDSAGAQTVVFSPDSEDLFLLRRRDDSTGKRHILRTRADLSGPVNEIYEVPENFRVSGQTWFCWAPGELIAMIDITSRELVLIEPGTGADARRLPLTGPDAGAEFGSLLGPFGDRHITLRVLRFDPDGFRHDLLLLDTETGALSTLIKDAGLARLLPGRRVLFSRDDTLFRARFDESSLSVVGDRVPLTDDLGADAEWENAWFEISARGELLHAGGGLRGKSRSIAIGNIDGTTEPWSDETRAFEQALAISRDKQRIASIVYGPGGLYELWVSDARRPRFRRLLAEPGADHYSPEFSPGGERLYLTRRLPGQNLNAQLITVPFSGAEEPTVLYESSSWLGVADVSPDGERVLAYEAFESGERRFIELNAQPPIADSAEQTPRVLLRTRASIYYATYAPNGQPLLAYITDETGEPIAVVRTISEDGLGPVIPVSPTRAWACGWLLDDAGQLALWHIGLNRNFFTTTVTLDDGVTLGETTPLGARADRVIAHDPHPDGSSAVILPGPDETPITRLEFIANWLDHTQ